MGMHDLHMCNIAGGTEFNDSIGSECKDRGKALEQGLRVASNLMAKGYASHHAMHDVTKHDFKKKRRGM